MANIYKDHNEKIVKLLEENPSLIKNQAWRLSNLYWIITKDGDKKVFTMNRAQKHFFDTYLNIPRKELLLLTRWKMRRLFLIRRWILL